MKKRNGFILLSALTLLPACSPTDSTVEYVSLKQAISNTEYYKLSYARESGTEHIFAIKSEDLFFYSGANGGYIKEPGNTGFYDSFTLVNDDDDVFAHKAINVYGRYGKRKNIEDVLYEFHETSDGGTFTYDFVDYINEYAADFTKIADDTYYSTVSMASELKNYFQSNLYGYTSIYEIKIGTDGRLASFSAYEGEYSDEYKIATFKFDTFDINSYTPYKTWKDGGFKQDIRIYDVKNNYTDRDLGANFCVYKDGETLSLTGIVASITEGEKSFIMSEYNDSYGYTGIEVFPASSSTLPSVNDEITVTGTVSSNGLIVSLSDASYIKNGTSSYAPTFDEESLYGSYGGGIYAASLFASAPQYSGSMYSTYAYFNEDVSKIDVSASSDTYVDLICPNISGMSSAYHMSLVLPKAMSVDDRKSLLSSFIEFGVYGSDTAKEVSFANMIVRYDPSYAYSVRLEYGSSSTIGKSLSPVEKIKAETGLDDFPLPDVDSYTCYKFGYPGSGMYIEEEYGKDPYGIHGVFFGATFADSDSKEAAIEAFSTYGFEQYDVISDRYTIEHTILRKDDVTLDYYISEGSFGSGDTIYIWIYKGDVVYYQSIVDKIEKNIAFFPSSDFIKPEGITDSNLNVFQLEWYAGNHYDEGNFLNCITMDYKSDDITDSNFFFNLRKSYREEKGYSTYMVDGKQYVYTAKGQIHYILYKDTDDGRIWLDFARYPTSDYTYYGHKKFDYRIEMVVYKGDNPILPTTSDNLGEFVGGINQEYNTGLSITLPAGSKVEMWPSGTGDNIYDYVSYGYLWTVNAFIYPGTGKTVSDVYDAIIDGLKASGYSKPEYGGDTDAGNERYFKESDGLLGSYVLIIKKDSYVRLLNGLGGVDF